MGALTDLLRIIVSVLGIIALFLSIPHFIAFRWPAAAMWGLKVVVSVFSPLLILIGVIAVIVGWTTNSPFIAFLGFAVIAMNIMHYINISGTPSVQTGFSHAFGAHWEASIPEDLKSRLLKSRAAFVLPSFPEARLQQDICFATIPGSDRKLLCDIWRPPGDVPLSGLAFVYLHGSAFYFLDKDFGTRTLFTQLAAQGHVIMDVAYRLAPETDLMGMVHDVNRAVAWMREQSGNYGVDPAKIVLGGGSAGGHLALLAAYTSGNAAFTPTELSGKDTSVCGVVSLYGTSDLEALYYHTNQHLTTRDIPGRPRKAVPTKMPGWMVNSVGKDYHRLGLDKGLENVGTLAPLLGGHPDERPEAYAKFSPVTHVHAGCPPTLLIHGTHDIMAPVEATRRLVQRLEAKKVQFVYHELPQVDHAFDLFFPKISPAAHNAIYDVERFLAVMCSTPFTNIKWSS